MMSFKVMKWNKYMWQQERNFVLTNKNVYNFNKKSKCRLAFKLLNFRVKENRSHRKAFRDHEEFDG